MARLRVTIRDCATLKPLEGAQVRIADIEPELCTTNLHGQCLYDKGQFVQHGARPLRSAKDVAVIRVELPGYITLQGQRVEIKSSFQVVTLDICVSSRI